MPRLARIFNREGIYHVITRGNNLMNIFNDEEDFQNYLSVLGICKSRYQFCVYHYVLMSNHVHLLVEITNDQSNLSQIMKLINLSYTQYYKKKYKHVGHFWQDRFKSIMIGNDNYLLECGAYIELNPVRAGIVERPEDYCWSSCRFYAENAENRFLDYQPAYCGLSDNPTKRKVLYRDFVFSKVDWKKANDVHLTKRYFYGNKDFISEMEKLFNIEATIPGRGRPRKI